MDGRRFPACLFCDLRRELSIWWSERLFAGGNEKMAGGPFLTSLLPPLLLLLLSGVLFFARLNCPLLEPEEARYAEIPRQMLAEGRWLTPVLHGEDYYQKPPLLYWCIMVCYQIFGVHDWAARLVPATTGILVVLLTYAWARQTVGPRAALASGLVLCLSARFLYLDGMVGMDSLLCLWVIGALACGHLALAPVGRHPRDRVGGFWWTLSALCCGLGIMTKGPVTAVLVLGPLMAWQYLDRRGPTVSLGRWLGYVGVALLVAGPWYVAVALHDPDATGTFFWLHNIVRYLAPFDHEKPSWFYLPGLSIGMVPWTFLLIPLVPYLSRRSPKWARRRPAGLGLFLLAFLWCLLFFSLSGCKRAAYILPALPALALVLGTFLARAFPWNTRTQLAFALTAGMTAVALILASYVMLPDYHSRFALRAVVRPHVRLARDMAVVCYPRRWDSVSFYLGREVACFGSEELGQLIGRLHDSETLLFVKSGNAFNDMLRALPQDLEFIPRGRQGPNMRVGLVQRVFPKS